MFLESNSIAFSSTSNANWHSNHGTQRALQPALAKIQPDPTCGVELWNIIFPT